MVARWSARGAGPGIDQAHAERLEVRDVAGRNRHPFTFGHRRDLSISHQSWTSLLSGPSEQAADDQRRLDIEGQDPTSEVGPNQTPQPLLETLASNAMRQCFNTDGDLGNDRTRQEEGPRRLLLKPSRDGGIRGRPDRLRNDIGVEDETLKRLQSNFAGLIV